MSNTSFIDTNISETSTSYTSVNQIGNLKQHGLFNKLKTMIGGSPFANYKLFRSDKKSKYLLIVLVLLAMLGAGLYLYMNKYIENKMNENKGKKEEKKETEKEEKKQPNLIQRVKEQIVKM